MILLRLRGHFIILGEAEVGGRLFVDWTSTIIRRPLRLIRGMWPRPLRTFKGGWLFDYFRRRNANMVSVSQDSPLIRLEYIEREKKKIRLSVMIIFLSREAQCV